MGPPGELCEGNVFGWSVPRNAAISVLLRSHRGVLRPDLAGENAIPLWVNSGDNCKLLVTGDN